MPNSVGQGVRVLYLQLVYISTARSPLGAADLDQVLATSRRNNAAADITGLLVVGGNRFLQLLEGPEAAVRSRFAAIRGDPRHFAIVVLAARSASVRQCPGWSMGHVAGGHAGTGATLESVVAALAAPIADKNLRAQFTGFAGIHGRAA